MDIRKGRPRGMGVVVGTVSPGDEPADDRAGHIQETGAGDAKSKARCDARHTWHVDQAPRGAAQAGGTCPKTAAKYRLEPVFTAFQAALQVISH